ncbi:MAG: hypothetical protein L0I24_10125 [Pseudonocardia sp.]|nr:hypothetical protein [Pseudonocardia sp.]
MGADDANQGNGPGECVEHVWRVTGMTLTAAGAHVDHECERCEALLVVGPEELTGRIG